MTFEEIDARYRAAALTVASGGDEWDDPEATPDADEDDGPGAEDTHDEADEGEDA